MIILFLHMQVSKKGLGKSQTENLGKIWHKYQGNNTSKNRFKCLFIIKNHSNFPFQKFRRISFNGRSSSEYFGIFTLCQKDNFS